MQKNTYTYIHTREKGNSVHETSQKRTNIKEKKYKRRLMQSENILLNVFRLRLNY